MFCPLMLCALAPHRSAPACLPAQVIFSENFGTEGRGGYFDQVGGQQHLGQRTCLPTAVQDAPCLAAAGVAAR